MSFHEYTLYNITCEKNKKLKWHLDLHSSEIYIILV